MSSILSAMPDSRVIYRPHPKIHEKRRLQCDLSEIDGVVVETHDEKSLADAISESALVVSVSSTASIEVTDSLKRKKQTSITCQHGQSFRLTSVARVPIVCSSFPSPCRAGNLGVPEFQQLEPLG